MPDLHVFRDDYEWYVATSIEDAMTLQRELTGIDTDDQDPEYWYQLPDDSNLSVYPGEIGEGEPVTQTCAAWIAEKGRGFLCSTEA